MSVNKVFYVKKNDLDHFIDPELDSGYRVNFKNVQGSGLVSTNSVLTCIASV